MQKINGFLIAVLLVVATLIFHSIYVENDRLEKEKVSYETTLKKANEDLIQTYLEKHGSDTALANLQYEFSLLKLQMENQQLKFQHDSITLALACKDSLLKQARAHTTTVERLATANTEKVIQFAKRLVDIAERYPDANRPRNITFSIRGTVTDTTITQKLK